MSGAEGRGHMSQPVETFSVMLSLMGWYSGSVSTQILRPS